MNFAVSGGNDCEFLMSILRGLVIRIFNLFLGGVGGGVVNVPGPIFRDRVNMFWSIMLSECMRVLK